MFEAMALEKVVVASDVAPVRDVIEHGRTGFLVDFFQPQALAERIGDVLAAPQSFREIGWAARRHVVERYDFQEKCFPAFVDFINRAMAPYGKQIEPGT
jgi:glycosyltransferase involved in cell wall biosynthesis